MASSMNGGRWLAVAVASCACGGPARPAAVTIHRAPPHTTPPAIVHVARPARDEPLAWPVAPFTASQAAEVKRCDVEKLASARYPKGTTLGELAGAYAPKDTCDQAVLAAACAARMEKSASPAPQCIEAYRATLSANPAFAFSNAVVDGYFGRVTVVAALPNAARALTSLTLEYGWGGLGTAVKWSLEASDLASHPALAVKGATGKTTWTPALAARVAALGTSLGSFLPIPKPIRAINCTDNYPEWTAKLAFDDGSKLDLTTNGSNLIGLGGPWQTTIGGHTYLQLAPDFAVAIGKLVQALGLPIGEPMGETCMGYDIQANVLGPPAP
jgi:hypothetical protein